MSSFFAFLKRMRFINRWSLMRNTETENIQEHSLEVAMVAHNLAALKNEYFGGNLDINKVAVIAIDRKSTRLNSSHLKLSRMPSSA